MLISIAGTFWDFYVGIVFALLYLCFVAYPISFRDDRRWSDDLSGLGLCGVGFVTVTIVLVKPVIWRVVDWYPKDPTTE